jgi:hypothetical protein
MLQQGSKRGNKKLFSSDGFSFTDKRQKETTKRGGGAAFVAKITVVQLQ